MDMLTPAQIIKILEEIKNPDEQSRRTLAKRRHDIYKDQGKQFLIEQVLREFNQDALKEMRLAPINLLKKFVNKRAGVYRRPPVRKTERPDDQKRIDFYEKALKFNLRAQKLNRTYVLDSNPISYVRPTWDKAKTGMALSIDIVGSHLYSVKTYPSNRALVDTYVFSPYTEGGATPVQSVPSATGYESFSTDLGVKRGDDLIDSSERDIEERKQFIFWNDAEHFTTDERGTKIPMSEGDLFTNPIGVAPIVRVCNDLDNEAWSKRGEDVIDLTMAVQMGWSDLLTIAKHQGFSHLLIKGENEPKNLTLGINKATFLMTSGQGADTDMSYVQANSPLDQYRELLTELVGLLLSTNDMDPSSVGSKASAREFTSGFHALIAMSDNLEAIEQDKPVMLDAELAQWDLIKRWHNLMWDARVLTPEAQALGKFSEDFSVSVTFAEIRPLESEDEKISRVEKLMGLGLITRLGALKKLNPDMDDKQIMALEEELDAEKEKHVAEAKAMIGDPQPDGESTPLPPEDKPIV